MLAILAGCNKKSEPAKDGIKDICGNIYSVVNIGNQTWMAENMRCDKYDTESEAYKKGIDYVVKMPCNDGYNYNPFFINASDPNEWFLCDRETDETAKSLCRQKGLSILTKEDISSLGYLYNWAAAVGLKDGAASKAQKSEFNKPRQGICPNGWHVPTAQELNELIKAAGGEEFAGKNLRKGTGWSCPSYGEEYDDFVKGSDTYGFSLLPLVLQGGACSLMYGYLWSSSSSSEYIDDSSNVYSFAYFLLTWSVGEGAIVTDDKMMSGKSAPLPVRCVKTVD